jgi:acetylornithine deacetylase
MRIKRPLQIALSFDEEVGCTGDRCPAMRGVVPKGAAVVVGGQPSSMRAVTGHKGGTGFNAIWSGSGPLKLAAQGG